MTKKKGKRNRLNRNTDKLANDNVKGEREIKGWINRYADQGQMHIRIGGKRTFADRRYKRDTQIGRQKNGYADWRAKRIYRLAKIGSNKKKKKTRNG